MTVVSQQQKTAGSYGGSAASQNPVPCDSGRVLYNLNMGTYSFTVQASDFAVRSLSCLSYLLTCNILFICLVMKRVTGGGGGGPKSCSGGGVLVV